MVPSGSWSQCHPVPNLSNSEGRINWTQSPFTFVHMEAARLPTFAPGSDLSADAILIASAHARESTCNDCYVGNECDRGKSNVDRCQLDGQPCIFPFRKGCWLTSADQRCSCPTLSSNGMASGEAELDSSRGYVCRWKSDLLKSSSDLVYLITYWKDFRLPVEYPQRWILNFAERLRIASEPQYAEYVRAAKLAAPGGQFENAPLFESCRHLLRKAGEEFCFKLFRHSPDTSNLPGDSDLGSTVLYGSRFLVSPSCRYMRDIMDMDGLYVSFPVDAATKTTLTSRDLWEQMYTWYCQSTSMTVGNPDPDFMTDLDILPSMTYECDCHSRNTPIPNTLLQDIGWIDEDVMLSDYMTQNVNRPEADILSRHIRRREYDIFSSNRRTAEDQDACWFRPCKDPQRFTRKDRTDSRIACPSATCLVTFNISNVRGKVNINQNNFNMDCGDKLPDCIEDNTASRAIKDGSCVCKPGFEGVLCDKEEEGETPGPSPSPSPSPGPEMPSPSPPRPTPARAKSDDDNDKDIKDIDVEEDLVRRFWWVGVLLLVVTLLFLYLLVRTRTTLPQVQEGGTDDRKTSEIGVAK